jgi:hypothetical protein
MSNGNGNVLGEVLLGLYIVNKVADKHQTKEAARAEGITYEEMKLRKMAAKARYKKDTARTERGQRKWGARVAKYDEELAHFAKTREQKQHNKEVEEAQ